MAELWFWIVALMVAGYAVLDGFDLGCGALHLFVARSDGERRQVLGAIGPLWDGNEVWLLAAGGALFLAFPKVLAAGFSGFYLALFLVLWLLLLRGISLEFRSHVLDSLWRTFWDGVFALASTLLPILLGAALGNVVRGVPLDATGTFSLPLFTTFRPRDPLGILDWYTVLMGLFVLATLLAHGATFLVWKTEGPVRARSRRAAGPLWLAVLALGLAATLATSRVAPGLFGRLPGAPLAWLAMTLFLAGLGAAALGLARERPLLAFLGSGAFIAGLLAATAACAFPVLLRSTLDPAWSLTTGNAASGAHGLRTGLLGWLLGFPLALVYLGFLFRLHRGKVSVAPEGEGY
jgi:cytochrome bd ubiquinol oxidase subunit II